MAIKGFYSTSGVPLLLARVTVPSLGTSADVMFLLDTGADHTTLHPYDMARLGIPIPGPSASSTSVGGIGGSVDYTPLDAALAFRGSWLPRWYRTEIPVLIPTTLNDVMVTDGLPSILGRDILGMCRCTFDLRKGRITLQP